MRTRLGLLLLALTVLGLPPAPAPAVEPTPHATPHTTQEASPAVASTPARGAAPAIPFVRGTHLDFGSGLWRLIRPDGTRQRLPRASWSDAATLGPAVVGSFGTEAGVAVDVVRPGHRTDRTVGYRHFGLVTTPDRSIVGYLLDDGRLRVLEQGGRRVLHLPAVPHADHPGALLGSGTCQAAYPEGGGCTAFVNGTRGRVWLSTSHGIVERLRGVRQVTAASARGDVLAQQSDGCWARLRAGGDEMAFRTCEVDALTGFSPSGHRVLGVERPHPYGDLRALRVFGRGGRLLTRIDLPHGFEHRVTDAAWEDDDHLLVVGYDGTRWHLTRYGIDGDDVTVEDAAAPVRALPDYPAFRLPVA